MDTIKTVDDLYDAIGKENLFLELNKAVMAFLDENTLDKNDLLNSCFLVEDKQVKISSYIVARDLAMVLCGSNMCIFLQDIYKKHNLHGELSSLVDTIIDDYIDSTEIKEVLNNLNAIVDNTYENLKDKLVLDSASDSRTIDDAIGDKSVIQEIIDLGQRDGNFIIISGEVVTGDSYATHSQLINEYIADYLHKDIDTELNDCRVRNSEYFDDIPNDAPLVFGHIVDNMAFVETCVNCTMDYAVDILKEKCSFDKIYQYDNGQNTIIRLAKKI